MQRYRCSNARSGPRRFCMPETPPCSTAAPVRDIRGGRLRARVLSVAAASSPYQNCQPSAISAPATPVGAGDTSPKSLRHSRREGSANACAPKAQIAQPLRFPCGCVVRFAFHPPSTSARGIVFRRWHERCPSGVISRHDTALSEFSHILSAATGKSRWSSATAADRYRARAFERVRNARPAHVPATRMRAGGETRSATWCR